MAKNRGGTESIKRKIDILSRIKTQLPRELGAEHVKFFKKNFDKQGFDGDSLEKWPPRKKNKFINAFSVNSKSARSKKVLTKTGALKRSIYISWASWKSIKISSNLKYSAIHNYGGTINHPGGTKYLWVDGKMVFVKKSSIYVTGVTKAHKIKIPQRRFMGRSRILNKIIVGKIETSINIAMRS